MNYVDVAELRASADSTGVALSVDDYPDADVTAAIELAEQLIERATKQWFYPKDVEITVDGTDSLLIALPVPIITVDALYINDDFDNAVDPTKYAVYNGRTPLEDHRRNPRIKLKVDSGRRDIYTRNDGGLRFRKGFKNTKVVGTFGFTEEDDSTPFAIVRAVKLLALEKIGALVVGGAPTAPPLPFAPGGIVEERTDGHSIRYAVAAAARKVGISGITANPEVEDIIRLYTAPKGIATQASFSTR